MAKKNDKVSYLHDNTYHFCWKGTLYNSMKSDQQKLQPCWLPHILALHCSSSSHFCCGRCEATTHSRCSYH
eukprot:1620372-Ditylum_brightwellii.AAC.1